jgi:hypothetical protein
VRDVRLATFRATEAVKQKSYKGMVVCNSRDGERPAKETEMEGESHPTKV